MRTALLFLLGAIGFGCAFAAGAVAALRGADVIREGELIFSRYCIWQTQRYRWVKPVQCL